jgi:hypothetical protein
MKSMDLVVRAARDRRVRRDTPKASWPFTLRDEEELTPLERVLVTLDVEQATGRTWPLEKLAIIRTVRELRAFFAGDGCERVVVHSLARYLGAEPSAIGLATDLRRDLRMATLDLELVLIRLETVGRVEFPTASAESVHTVGALVDMFRSIARKRAERLAMTPNV